MDPLRIAWHHAARWFQPPIATMRRQRLTARHGHSAKLVRLEAPGGGDGMNHARTSQSQARARGGWTIKVSAVTPTG